jgi:hypothetical protein
MREYKNRYGDVFTFSQDGENDILWQGNFEFCRIGMPNNYTKAYDQYLKDNEGNQSLMTLKQFESAVHGYDDETLKWDYPKYLPMIESLKDEIDMVDPSGGPYLCRGMLMDSFGFKDCIIEDFKPIDTGFKIIIKKDGTNT